VPNSDPEYFGLDRLERDFTPGRILRGTPFPVAPLPSALERRTADLKTQVHLNGRFRHSSPVLAAANRTMRRLCHIPAKNGRRRLSSKVDPERCGSGGREKVGRRRNGRQKYLLSARSRRWARRRPSGADSRPRWARSGSSRTRSTFRRNPGELPSLATKFTISPRSTRDPSGLG